MQQAELQRGEGGKENTSGGREDGPSQRAGLYLAQSITRPLLTDQMLRRNQPLGSRMQQELGPGRAGERGPGEVSRGRVGFQRVPGAWPQTKCRVQVPWEYGSTGR